MLLELVKYCREVNEVVRDDGGRGVWLPPLPPPLPLLVLPLQSASLAKFSMLCSSMVPRPPTPRRVPTVPPGRKSAIERLNKGGVGVGAIRAGNTLMLVVPLAARLVEEEGAGALAAALAAAARGNVLLGGRRGPCSFSLSSRPRSEAAPGGPPAARPGWIERWG